MIYNRNRYYISDSEQLQIKQYKILLAGCGIGSNIAECALRIGFENQTLIDGDRVELTNLNRQNYRYDDINSNKPEALKKRLLSISSKAVITSKNIFLNNENVEECLTGHNVAINALDFQSNVPFKFDELCQKHNIPVLHPYNIGWATLVFVILPNGPNLSNISTDYKGFEKKVVSFLIEKLKGYPKLWIQSILSEYEEKGQGQSPPQLSVGSWLAAGACTNILYRLATGKPIRQFPDFYFLTTEE